MSAPLPGNFLLPADRELGHLERLTGPLEVIERVERALRWGAARREFRAGISELDTLAVSRESIDEWSRKTFRHLSDVFYEVLEVVARPEFVSAVRADLEAQRAELNAFLSPLNVGAQADWALVALQLTFDALKPHIAGAKIPPREELEAQLSSLDFAGPMGASMRVACFLTWVLEAARAGQAPSARHATFVGLAFVEAVTMLTAIARELGTNLDPTPYLLSPREAVAREGLLRLLALPRDESFNSFLGPPPVR